MSSILRLRFEEAFKTDEIILNIFGYLSPNDIIYSFFNLNARFNTLISSRYIQHFDPSSLTYEQFIYFTKKIIPVVSNDVETLVITNKTSKCYIKILLRQSSKPFTQLFSNIQKIVLTNLNLVELDIYSKKLKYLSQLKHLLIHFNGILKTQEIETRVFNDLFLSNTCLQSFQCENDDPVGYHDTSLVGLKYFAPSSYYPSIGRRKRILSKLTDITIQLRCFKDIIWLFEIAPNVKTLKLDLYTSCADTDVQDIEKQFQTFIQPKNLEELHLKANPKRFHLLELLFQRLSPSGGGKLRRLYLNIQSHYDDYNRVENGFIDGNRWQPLVTDLDEFHCLLRAHLGNLNDDEKQLMSFRTPFWLDKKKFCFKNYYRRVYDWDYDHAITEIFYLETIPYHFSNLRVKSAEAITMTNKQEILSPYHHVTSLDCRNASLRFYLNFMLECRLNIKELYLSLYSSDSNHTEIDQLELSFPKLKYLSCSIQHYGMYDEPKKDTEYCVKFAMKLLTLSPNLQRLRISMETISEISRLKQDQSQQLPLFCTRLKCLGIYGCKELTSKEVNEIQDVFQQSLNKIQYLNLNTKQTIIIPFKFSLKTSILKILSSFTNLHYLTITFKSLSEEDWNDHERYYGLRQYPKDKQMENYVKRWLINNTHLKDMNKFYIDSIKNDSLTIFM